MTVEAAVMEGLPRVLADISAQTDGLPRSLRQFVYDVARAESRYSFRPLVRAIEVSTYAQCSTVAQSIPEFLRQVVLRRLAHNARLRGDLLEAMVLEEDANHAQNVATVQYTAHPTDQTKALLVRATMKQKDASRHLVDVLHTV